MRSTMSDTYAEAVHRANPLNRRAAASRLDSLAEVDSALLRVFLWIASEAISLAIQHTRLRKSLRRTSKSAFGRPVEVGSYDFSFWDGPSLEANSVTVGEDPRFGQEYFLRADSMTVRLRWEEPAPRPHRTRHALSRYAEPESRPQFRR